jgi:hypothetical protein
MAPNGDGGYWVEFRMAGVWLGAVCAPALSWGRASTPVGRVISRPNAKSIVGDGHIQVPLPSPVPTPPSPRDATRWGRWATAD